MLFYANLCVLGTGPKIVPGTAAKIVLGTSLKTAQGTGPKIVPGTGPPWSLPSCPQSLLIDANRDPAA